MNVKRQILEGCIDSRCYEDYLKFRNKVFVNEIGWGNLPYSAARSMSSRDPLDRHSIFILARDCNGEIIGTVRGYLPQDELPYTKLYEQYYKRADMKIFFGMIFFINSLAVDIRYRSKPIFSGFSEHPIKLSSLLLLWVIDALISRGARFALATASSGAAEQLFINCGFVALSKKISYSWAPVSLLHMALDVHWVNHDRFCTSAGWPLCVRRENDVKPTLTLTRNNPPLLTKRDPPGGRKRSAQKITRLDQ